MSSRPDTDARSDAGKPDGARSGALPLEEGASPSGKRRVIIRTLDLKKHYVMKTVITEALRGVDSEIYTGEFISVMGPSGSGKSTYFNMIGGLDSPT